ncbi:hypothetical protein M9H77_23898 [Catharanthus roseus]|uniref:Uncharacterized protein n=1 Tax=Catharanthus roseus TaxID=4058 RepID=A0ACC0AW42_CATRO|nr:hypothetical protein M9H77_23898 [Catharanthus roseus]
MVEESLKTHAMEEKKAEEKGVSMRNKVLLNPFLFHWTSVNLKLFLELYASYVTLVGNLMDNPFTCELALNVAHMFKCLSPCAYLEKQLLDSVSKIKLSYHTLSCYRLTFSLILLLLMPFSSCASMWSKIHIFLGSFVESGYVERVSYFSCSLRGVFHAKLKVEFVENSDYGSSFLYACMKNFDGFITSIKLLHFVSHQFKFPYDEQKFLGTILEDFATKLLI